MEEDYNKMSLEDRCGHKLWKIRVSGYEEIAKLFQQIDDDKSTEFAKYLSLIGKFVVDCNVIGQEKGLEAALIYVKNYAYAGKTVSDVLSGVVNKCIAASKSRNRELALQLILMYIEIGKYEAVQSELLKGMEQKNPKILAACINASTISLREFGPKIVNIKPLVKKIPLFYTINDKTVRDETRNLIVEMYRWVGEALRSQLTNLQTIQIMELEAEFTKIDGEKAVPSRFIRSKPQKQTNVITDPKEVEMVNSPQLDSFDLVDPVDVLSKLPENFYEKIEAKNWQERKLALEALENLLKVPKLQDGYYGDLVNSLKEIIDKDTIILLVILAGKCLTALANGLRNEFQQYAERCIPSLLEKFKEKKHSVVVVIRKTIDTMYLTTNMKAIIDDIIEALGNKNPSVKAETALFIARASNKTKALMFNKKILKMLTTALLNNIYYPDPIVRDCTVEALGSISKVVGEEVIMPFLSILENDNVKMSKIKEFSINPAIIDANKNEKSPITTKGEPSINKQMIATPIKIAKNKSTKNNLKVDNKNINAIGLKSKTNTKSKSRVAGEKVLSDDEVDQIIAPIISANVVNQLSASDWKIRLAAVDQFFKKIRSLESKDIPAQAVVKVLCNKPGLKERIFQVLKIKLDFIKYLADNSNFSITTTAYCIHDIIENFSDNKYNVIISETLTSIAEATSLPHICTIVINTALSQKSPKLLQECITWLGNAIKDFGIGNLNFKLLLEFAKKTIASSNPGVRQAGVIFCGILYLYMEPKPYSFFENEKAAIREQIKAEFSKYEGLQPPQPTRGIAKNWSRNTSTDDNISRIDISSQITESLLNEISDDNWKICTEALTKVRRIIEEAKFIQPNIGDLPQALIPRLSDNKTEIAEIAFNICKIIAESMGPSSQQYIQCFFPHFLQNLGHNRSWNRLIARDAIDIYVKECGYKELFKNDMIVNALKTGSSLLKIELCTWLAEELPKIKKVSIPKDELLACVPHLYNNLEDEDYDVKKSVHQAILAIMTHVDYASMLKYTEPLKPILKKIVLPILEKIRPKSPDNLSVNSILNENEEKCKKVDKTVVVRKTNSTEITRSAINDENLIEYIDKNQLNVQRITPSFSETEFSESDNGLIQDYDIKAHKPLQYEHLEEVTKKVINNDLLLSDKLYLTDQIKLKETTTEKENVPPELYIPKKTIEDTSDLSKIDENKIPLSMSLNSNSSINTLTFTLPERSNSKKEDCTLNSWLNQIKSNNVHIMMSALTKVTSFLKENNSELFMEYEIEFMNAIATGLMHMRNQEVPLYWSTLTCMDAFYDKKVLGRQASAETLKIIIDELIHASVNDKIDSYSSISQCRLIIDRSDHTNILCGLIQLMQQYVMMDVTSQQTDIVMRKCLLYAIQQMSTWADNIKYDLILLEIHIYLKQFPTAWWKNKPTNDPLKIIIKAIKECVKIKKDSIMLHFNKITDTNESELEWFVLQLLKISV